MAHQIKPDDKNKYLLFLERSSTNSDTGVPYSTEERIQCVTLPDGRVLNESDLPAQSWFSYKDNSNSFLNETDDQSRIACFNHPVPTPLRITVHIETIRPSDDDGSYEFKTKVEEYLIG